MDGTALYLRSPLETQPQWVSSHNELVIGTNPATSLTEEVLRHLIELELAKFEGPIPVVRFVQPIEMHDGQSSFAAFVSIAEDIFPLVGRVHRQKGQWSVAELHYEKNIEVEVI